jgi:uncharacterized DUF497 family protein
VRFEWNTEKEKANVRRHGVDFTEATAAFCDPKHLITADEEHSAKEARLFCIGRTDARDSNRSFHLSRRHHSDHRRRLLEERQALAYAKTRPGRVRAQRVPAW